MIGDKIQLMLNFHFIQSIL